MSDSSEEKKRPPTPKKLRQARKKGQIPRSADFVSALSICAAFGCLCFRAGAIEGVWREGVRLVDKLQGQPFNSAVQQALVGLIELSLTSVAPIIGAAVAAGILASVLAAGGLTFSVEPLKPSLKKLDPIKGLKRIVSQKSLVELGKSLIKVFLLGVTLFFTSLASWKALVYLPVCGLGCFSFVFKEVKFLIEIAAGAFLIGGLTDLLIQRWLFLRDMRMTESEAKRESKEQEGNPHVKGEHRRLRRESASEPPLGVNRATLILTGPAMLVGLRYVRGQTGVPVLVCRGEDELASQLFDQARALHLSIIQEPALARQLIRKGIMGKAVPKDCFEGVAKAVFAAGLV
ncbi:MULTISPECIES: EscU/YscU/HrcU family type III secretion system export apparatus switch protein [Bradyrhizobium]|uniref:EscU/YscU/HrcU family type III secretion system export apparatus switch protein n=3 Tax=Bradyrhizobium TaxID=374 RepID=A0A410VJA1_9BRAD|nr:MULTISPECIES: EscU/YscU/HrcU family type III secretion system export apparatus switch protein [Bradyrhizobium]MCG2632863.1 EscU/YscU/HrcU family type III secretion system export apparatus switch protein [Bradyrhizobium zhengyangense]MCG2645476.1 EscU/YscU/HrcU family type III secretion system export apparatus switch protein [Bradyrhizobium zhengyangense]MCG2673035.1 EscU/YscU/HrcU family type III secretion system export apparatus switch protein [Bradyrhizobium zhengyangense]MDN4984438.1 EscU